VRDPRILELTKRVKATATEEADRRMPDAMLCRMELATKSGETHRATVEYHKGHWKNPMTDAEVEAKFRTLAAHVLKPPEIDRLLESLWRLEELDDAGEAVRLTKTGQPG
jgi:2-methylcitrate dehydratase